MQKKGSCGSRVETDTTGTLKVRTNVMMQRQVQITHPHKTLARSQNAMRLTTPKKAGTRAVAPKKKSMKTLAEITERARERLKTLKMNRGGA